MTTGQRIKEARKKAGLTQKELATKLGIAYQTLAQWENDLRNPKPGTLEKIANALGINWLCLIPGIERGSYIAADVIERAGLTVTDDEGHTIKQGDGKPFRKMSDSEMNKAGLLKFNSEEDRIAHFYSKLNTDGRLIAAKCFYKNLDSTKLSEVADYVEQLADTPQFQKTDTKEEK